MLAVKHYSSSFLSFGAVVEAVRVRLAKSDREKNTLSSPERTAAPTTADSADTTSNMDQVRYARLLDHELDRQLLTEVEREDTEMLNRVRAALYAE